MKTPDPTNKAESSAPNKRNSIKPAQFFGTDSPVEKVLTRLESVRNRQPGQWSARCPAHADKAPSLSLREAPDGAVLIHCFAGCEVFEIIAAIGLEFHDLFPPRGKPTSAPKRIARLLTAQQALELLATEMTLVVVAAGNVAHGVTLSEADLERVLLAGARINWLRDQTMGGRHD